LAIEGFKDPIKMKPEVIGCDMTEKLATLPLLPLLQLVEIEGLGITKITEGFIV
jgi:hypothetical protein